MQSDAIEWRRKGEIEEGAGAADRRGYSGYPEPVFYEGVHVADRTRYSDQLLMFRLKALAPE